METQTTVHPRKQVLKVYYDGLCVLCSAEIRAYQRMDKDSRIEWIDIMEPGFDAHREGLEPANVRRHLHAKTATGEVITGVDAFVAIWREIPRLHSLAKVSALPGLRAIMRVGYEVFVRVRPYLPRKRAMSCESGSCER